MSDKKLLTKRTIQLIKAKYEGKNEGEEVLLEEETVDIVNAKILKYLCQYLRKNKSKKKDFEVNLDNHITIGVNYLETEGEKVGNYVPYIRLGSVLLEKLGIAAKEEKVKDKDIEKVFKFVLEKMEKENIEVKDERRNAEESFRIIYLSRLQAMIDILLEEIKDAEEASITEGEFYSIKIKKAGDSFDVDVFVGPETKLLIKDDEDTEGEDE